MLLRAGSFDGSQRRDVIEPKASVRTSFNRHHRFMQSCIAVRSCGNVLVSAAAVPTACHAAHPSSVSIVLLRGCCDVVELDEWMFSDRISGIPLQAQGRAL
jgi:hypothetical protein